MDIHNRTTDKVFMTADFQGDNSHDKEMLSDSWRVKIVAAGDGDWDGKRMCQLLDRMDRMSGDGQNIDGALNMMLGIS